LLLDALIAWLMSAQVQGAHEGAVVHICDDEVVECPKICNVPQAIHAAFSLLAMWSQQPGLHPGLFHIDLVSRCITHATDVCREYDVNLWERSTAEHMLILQQHASHLNEYEQEEPENPGCKKQRTH